MKAKLVVYCGSCHGSKDFLHRLVQVRFLRNNWRRKEWWKKGKKKYSEFYTLCQTTGKNNSVTWKSHHMSVGGWLTIAPWFRAEIAWFPKGVIAYTILRSRDGDSGISDACFHSFSFPGLGICTTGPVQSHLACIPWQEKKCDCCCLDGLKLMICIFSLC